MKLIRNYRYLILRRLVQLSLLLLLIAGNYWGWKILNGNFSTALLFDYVPLSDPYAVLQIDRSASMQDVKRVYHALSRQYHPDRGERSRGALRLSLFVRSRLRDPQSQTGRIYHPGFRTVHPRGRPKA